MSSPASLEATNLDVEFSQAHYGSVRAAASVGAGSELIAEGTSFGRWLETKNFSQRAIIERCGFMWSYRVHSVAWRMANCSRESRTGPGRSTFPDPPSRRWSIATSAEPF